MADEGWIILSVVLLGPRVDLGPGGHAVALRVGADQFENQRPRLRVNVLQADRRRVELTAS